MRFRSLLVVTLVVLTANSQIALAAGDSPQNAGAQFAKMFGSWKILLAKAVQLQDRYKNDPSADKKALEAEYTEVMKKAVAMSDPLGSLAEKAFLAEPNKSKDVNDFLVATLTGRVVGDDYEKAAVLANLLLEHKLEHNDLNFLAGMAFFATNDFENAEKYLKLAKENGKINQNGVRYLEMAEKYKSMWAKEKAIREKEDAVGDLPKVKLQTSKGDIVVALYENEAPIATANFISLVEKGYYNGLVFHRVLPGFMAQGGDPKGDGSGGPGYTIPDECRQDNHREHFRGTLSMAKTAEPDTGGSQFFLTFVPTSHLDGKHTAFGRVIEGMDVLAKLQRTEPTRPPVLDKIVKATVISKRPHKYEPVKRPDKATP
jgi:cyclophilin family peptidyl-prolyl cis-trans isomerase